MSHDLRVEPAPPWSSSRFRLITANDRYLKPGESHGQ